MERITMSLETGLAEQFDHFISQHGYTNRSEAMRDLIRERLEGDRLKQEGNGFCIATLSYVYNHHERELASRITNVHHHHHELNLCSLHVHMDHDNCMEVAVIRGPVKLVQSFSDALMAERGIRHGKLNMVPISMEEISHTDSAMPHTHSHPIT